jgi:hypothetical protein
MGKFHFFLFFLSSFFPEVSQKEIHKIHKIDVGLSVAWSEKQILGDFNTRTLMAENEYFAETLSFVPLLTRLIKCNLIIPHSLDF